MTPLITLEEAKEALRVDHDEADAIIEHHARAASEIVLGYINRPVTWYDPETDAVGDVPDRVKKAVAHLVLYFFDDPHSEDFKQGQLPAPVTSILYPLRALSLS